MTTRVAAGFPAKAIPVAVLKRILAGMRDDDMIYTNTLADTGNLPVERGGETFGLIEIRGEQSTLTPYERADGKDEHT